jgi:DNA-binding transcriptional LysR family regulator
MKIHMPLIKWAKNCLQNGGKSPRTPDDMAGHDCISYAGFASPDVWTFVRDETNVAVPVHSRLVVNSVEAACDAASAGIGITSVFSYHIESALQAGTLTTLPDEFQPTTRPFNLLYAANRFLPIKVRAFLDFYGAAAKASFPTIGHRLVASLVTLRPPIAFHSGPDARLSDLWPSRSPRAL